MFNILFVLIYIATLTFIMWSGVKAEGHAAPIAAFLVALGVTMCIKNLVNWYKTRFERRASKPAYRALIAEQRAIGYPYGWRIHLPWNSHIRSWEKFRDAYYHKHDFYYLRGRDVYIDPRTGFVTWSRLVIKTRALGQTAPTLDQRPASRKQLP